MIYFDNSATTRVNPEVVEAMLPYLYEEYGNPASKYYTLAVNAQRAVEISREQVAQLIGAAPDEIIFTAGATESTNLIIKGVADYRRFYEAAGNHIITSNAEHHATLHTCKFLNGEVYSNNDATFSFGTASNKVDRGYSVTFLEVDRYGQVDCASFEKAILPTTVLASFIWGNNEIGTLNDIPSLCAVAHKYRIPLHADATQVIGKLPIDLRQVPIDYLSLSGHKFGAPKGIGAAFLRGDAYGLPPITALLHGGSQESGVRAGTLPVHNIVGLGKAAEITSRQLQQQLCMLRQITECARDALGHLEYVDIISNASNGLPGIISIVVNDPSFNNERFIRRVSKDIALSTGSACTAGKPSHVLTAIGRAKDTSRVLRLSLSCTSTQEEIEQFISTLKTYLGR